MAAGSLYKILTDTAKGSGVELIDAVRHAGIHEAQFYRWRDKKTQPNGGSFGRALKAIAQLARKRSKTLGKANGKGAAGATV